MERKRIESSENEDASRERVKWREFSRSRVKTYSVYTSIESIIEIESELRVVRAFIKSYFNKLYLKPRR